MNPISQIYRIKMLDTKLYLASSETFDLGVLHLQKPENAESVIRATVSLTPLSISSLKVCGYMNST